jgi:hypothetical protein
MSGCMNEEFQYIWKEVFMTYFTVLFIYFPRGTKEEIHKTSVMITGVWTEEKN